VPTNSSFFDLKIREAEVTKKKKTTKLSVPTNSSFFDLKIREAGGT
jgi:hypothetical protein